MDTHSASSETASSASPAPCSETARLSIQEPDHTTTPKTLRCRRLNTNTRAALTMTTRTAHPETRNPASAARNLNPEDQCNGQREDRATPSTNLPSTRLNAQRDRPKPTPRSATNAPKHPLAKWWGVPVGCQFPARRRSGRPLSLLAWNKLLGTRASRPHPEAASFPERQRSRPPLLILLGSIWFRERRWLGDDPLLHQPTVDHPVDLRYLLVRMSMRVHPVLEGAFTREHAAEEILDVLF